MTVHQHFDRIKAVGPSRILINAEGKAVRPADTDELYLVVFIRKDGWSLGAPSHLETPARAVWPDQWAGVMRWHQPTGRWELEVLQ